MFLPRSRQLVAMGKEDFFAHEEPTSHHSLHQVVIQPLWGSDLTSPPAFQVDYTEKSGYKPGVAGDHRDGVSSYLGLNQTFDNNGSSRPSLIALIDLSFMATFLSLQAKFFYLETNS